MAKVAGLCTSPPTSTVHGRVGKFTARSGHTLFVGRELVVVVVVRHRLEGGHRSAELVSRGAGREAGSRRDGRLLLYAACGQQRARAGDAGRAGGTPFD